MSRHKWIKSTLGHGELMCAKCGITNREAAALRCMEECIVPDTSAGKTLH